MLSEKSRPVIEATLPLVGSRIGAITPKFYSRLFPAHPESAGRAVQPLNQRGQPAAGPGGQHRGVRHPTW